MKVDNTSIFFKAPLEEGQKGGTAAWGTSVGQSKRDGYKIDTTKEGIIDFLIGMNYKIKTDSNNLDISDGSKSRELLMFSVFDKVYINNILLTNKSFIVLLVKEHSENHDGRIIISYPSYASYKRGDIEITNLSTFNKMADTLGCPNGSWFVHDISVKNQDEIHFSAIVISDSQIIYKSSQARKIEWDLLVDREKENNITQIPFNYNSFTGISNKSGLLLKKEIIERFVASLCTKPFVILSGLSGSGKTKIAQAFVYWICESSNQYKIVPVGADWTNREPLLGYPNGLESDLYITPDSGVIHLLMEASKEVNKNKPFFLVLDEMNLSHVERYFADFLSIMESNDSIKLYTGNKRESLDGLKVDFEIKWPKNLFIIGTVNIDETTYMFSPKVLDRANVIEFRITETEIEKSLEKHSIPNLDSLRCKGAEMASSFLSLAEKTEINYNKSVTKELVQFFNELKKVGAEFGYRSAFEIMQLIEKLKLLEPNINEDDCIDIAIMQKLLPKLHGSRNKLTKVLPTLGGFCLADNSKIKEDYLDKFVSNSLSEVELKADSNIKYKISFEKICRMYKNAIENGFASYAEA
jgi:MoxR-like ATPase